MIVGNGGDGARRFLGRMRDFIGRRAFGPPRRPLFIIGCGRSGTTILGKTLGHHPRVAYLHEPRDLWARAYPRTDIWSDRAAERGGRLVLDAEDIGKGEPDLLRWLFRYRALRERVPQVVEKLPINTFRLPFLDALFPDAAYVHLRRDARAVAGSIARMAEEGRWWGHGEYKWHRLVEHARAGPATGSLPELCRSEFDRGLLEWRLSNDAATSFFDAFPAHRTLTLTYEGFTEKPAATMRRLFEFLEIPRSSEVAALAGRTVRPARRGDEVNLTPERRRILGDRAPE